MEVSRAEVLLTTEISSATSPLLILRILGIWNLTPNLLQRVWWLLLRGMGTLLLLMRILLLLISMMVVVVRHLRMLLLLLMLILLRILLMLLRLLLCGRRRRILGVSIVWRRCIRMLPFSRC